MAAGRPVTPGPIKKLRGNPARRPIPKEPPVDGKMPSPPDHLDPEAKREWKRVASDLHQAGLLKQVDRVALGAYCQVYSRWVKAEAALKKEGMFVMSGNGYKIPHPANAVVNKTLVIMKSYLVEFGMTPAARMKVGTIEEKQSDPFEEFVKERLGKGPLEGESE